MSHATITSRFFLKVLEKAQHGSVRLTCPDGQTETYGVGSPLIHVQVRDWRVFDSLVARGDLGLAESIMDGTLVVDDPAALIEWACRNDQSLGNALSGTWTGTFVSQVKKVLSFNSKRGARQNILSHYDLGNEFYRLWLDSSMTYSSGIFASPDQSLRDAQMAKYDRMIDLLDIRSGDRVLEIGCGWGGFFSRAVERTGCHVTAVLNSAEQARHNRQLISEKGIVAQVDLQEIDYRDIRGQFDKVVSIEMIEAVGERYWPTYFSKLASSLKSKGSAVIQGITIREDLFYSYRRGTDFIQQYVFPGGMLLTPSKIQSQGQSHDLELASAYEFGASYAQTLKVWRMNFEKARQDVVAMGFDDRFIRMWDLYLAYCEGAFRAGRINVGQFQLSR